MKKILIIICILLNLTGCGKLNNTPTKRVEELLDNYKMVSENVVSDLNNLVDSKKTFNETQKETYKEIMKKQYNDLMYEIKDEVINGDKAIVTVQITVKDFNKVLEEARDYYELHKDEFLDNTGKYESKYIDYRLDKLKNAKEKVTYTLNISLTKENKEWKLDGLTDADLDKINGIYDY